MLKKKFFAKALAFAMVTGLMATSAPVGLGTQLVQVMAAENPAGAPAITVNYTNYTATITLSGAKYIFLEVLKDESGEKVSGTYGYKADNSGAVTVDLSFLKAAKDQYIRAYTDKLTDGAYVRCNPVKISAQPAKLAMKYDPVKGLVDGKTKAAIEFGEANKEVYSFKTLYGSTWAPLTSTALTDKNVAGTTIIVRKTAVETQGDTLGTPASAEIKVKIPAIPKAPKVTIDYVKGLVKLGKNTQYATLADALLDKWTDTTEAAAKGAEVEKLLDELKGTASTVPDTTMLVVRTKATDKKAASQWTFVVLNKLATLTAGTGEDPKVGGTLTLGDKKLTWANTSKGISLKPEGSAFDYYDNTKKAWKAVAAGKTVEVALKSGDKLQVRAAGTKATKEAEGSFFSAATELTCTTLPAKVEITAPTTTFKIGGTINATYTAKAIDGNGTEVSGATITWKSSNDAVATVANGSITAKTAGKATITASVGDIEATVEITVEAAAQ